MISRCTSLLLRPSSSAATSAWDAVSKERAVQLARTIEEGKPEHIAEKIVEGRMNKWFQDVCLLEQKFVKDDEKTIEQVVQDTVATIGEHQGSSLQPLRAR